MTKDIKKGEKLPKHFSDLLTKKSFTTYLRMALKNSDVSITWGQMYQVIKGGETRLNDNHLKVIKELVKVINDESAITHTNLYDTCSEAEKQLEDFKEYRKQFDNSINRI